MTTYSAIANSEIAVGAPLTNSLMTKNRDNPLAMQENDVSAPTIAFATEAGTITSQGALATLDGVTQSTVDANAIGQSELKDTTGAVSVVGNGNFTLAGGSYGFYPQVRDTSGSMTASIASSVTSASYITNVFLNNNGGGTEYAQQRYFTASRPYDLGDGEVGRFIFAVIDNVTDDVVMAYQATEAPWHYNGKTDVRGKIGKDGKKYRLRKDMGALPFTFNSALGDTVKMKEYVDAFILAETTSELITQEIYQRDMTDIPHPFMNNDLTGKTIVMLDPVSDLNHKLSEMCSCHDEFNLNSLFHDGHLTISNTSLNRSGPTGIIIPSFKWKKTK